MYFIFTLVASCNWLHTCALYTYLRSHATHCGLKWVSSLLVSCGTLWCVHVVFALAVSQIMRPSWPPSHTLCMYISLAAWVYVYLRRTWSCVYSELSLVPKCLSHEVHVVMPEYTCICIHVTLLYYSSDVHVHALCVQSIWNQGIRPSSTCIFMYMYTWSCTCTCRVGWGNSSSGAIPDIFTMQSICYR